MDAADIIQGVNFELGSGYQWGNEEAAVLAEYFDFGLVIVENGICLHYNLKVEMHNNIFLAKINGAYKTIDMMEPRDGRIVVRKIQPVFPITNAELGMKIARALSSRKAKKSEEVPASEKSKKSKDLVDRSKRSRKPVPVSDSESESDVEMEEPSDSEEEERSRRSTRHISWNNRRGNTVRENDWRKNVSHVKFKSFVEYETRPDT